MGRACRVASAGGEGGYGSAASQVPVRQRSFLYPAFLPQSDGQDRKTMDAMDEQPLHLQRDMTHDAFRRYLEARTELAELASVLIVGVDSNSLIVASRTPVWQVRGEGGYGIQHPEELLRVVGGYDTAADKGTIPYPTGQISGTLCVGEEKREGEAEIMYTSSSASPGVPPYALGVPPYALGAPP